MTTLLMTHSACLYHETPSGHPECSDRLRAVLHALEDEAFQYLAREEAPLATREQVSLVHPAYFVDAVLKAVPTEGFASLDPDTHLSPASGEAALRAAGGVVTGVDRVMAGKARNVFCAVRPPGHHAEPTRAMGFCLFNNVAIGAQHARARHGLKRVAVVDFDVHHGNGTQAAFLAEREVLYVSLHQWPLFPGTGWLNECGVADGEGFTVNLPLPPGCGDGDYAHAFARVVEPIVDEFAPQAVLVSAGFDSHARDPLGSMKVTESGYAHMALRCLAMAQRHAEGRLALALEGGYNLPALGRSVEATMRALSDEAAPDVPATAGRGQELVERVVAVQQEYWHI